MSRRSRWGCNFSSAQDLLLKLSPYLRVIYRKRSKDQRRHKTGRVLIVLGLRNLYRVFHESRSAARKEATLAVVGDTPEAERLADLLDTGRGTRGAEILATVSGARDGGVEVSLSGKAVE